MVLRVRFFTRGMNLLVTNFPPVRRGGVFAVLNLLDISIADINNIPYTENANFRSVSEFIGRLCDINHNMSRPLESVDILRLHRNSKRNNLQLLASTQRRMLCSHKTTGRHPSALHLWTDVHTLGK